ncbi:hypothetical protein [Pseudalkalibacillus hwajinpoensis]|uniref:hypothetical protein n=1 Tax=Guptibacillus hwajinpoensis TaxID=208199 RepID=UPI001CFE449D|nr:hypothetical protein [Pseudalkalibacillus hwajinpoensis]
MVYRNSLSGGSWKGMITLKILSRKQFEKACEFIALYARPLDREYFAYWRGVGEKERVLQELEVFRNEDGGFGNNIEPDFRLQKSSPLGTTIAFQYLYQLNINAQHPFVVDGTNYFLHTFQTNGWQSVPLSVNDVPHAPWWHVSDKIVNYSANPDAEIVGYLIHYDVQHPLTTKAFDIVMNHLKDLNEYEIHEVQCYLRLAKLAGGDVYQKIHQKIEQKLSSIIDPPEKWNQYGVQPISLADSIQSPFAKELNQELDVNLDYLIEKQLDNGSWEPSWSWGQFEDQWEVAKREWQGVLTVQNLITLSKFGRIESSTV